MSRTLAATVILDGVTYLAGTTPPDEVAERITNPRAWGSSPAATPTPVDVVEDQDQDDEAELDLDVPTGTVAETLAWVGDDKARAAAALAVEADGKARSTLIEALAEVIG